MSETYEITSVSLVMRPTAVSSIQVALAALMSSTIYLDYTRKASSVKVTIHTDGSSKPYVIAAIEYPSSSTDEPIKSGLLYSEGKTSYERLLPRHVENGEDTLQQFASGRESWGAAG